MFDAHNAPVTPTELRRFAGAVTSQIDDTDLHRADSPLAIAVDDSDTILLMTSDRHDHPATLSQIDQLLAARRRMIAMVSVTGWSPADNVPVSAAWVLIAVGRGGGPACAAVRRIEEDNRWTLIAPSHLPWIALSTAGGLRRALRTEKLQLKQASSTQRHLYSTPDECPDPPVDEHGRL